MENRKVCLTRSYTFSAAHYLSSPFLGEEENRNIYGKCGRPTGHGHNYTLSITVKGPVDKQTGMVINTAEMDEIVNCEIIEPLDHRNLNRELKGGAIPTSEFLIEEVHNRLKKHFRRIELYKVELNETRKNSFEYGLS